MKKLLYILILFPFFSFSQEFKIEYKVNDDKSIDLDIKNLSQIVLQLF